jgi:hypothetical protein
MSRVSGLGEGRAVDNKTYLVVDVPQLAVTHDFDECVTEVAVQGAWSDELRARISQTLRGCVAEMPRAIIVDLSTLIDPAGASASTLRTACRYAAARRPAVDLIICAAQPPVLRRLRAATPRRAVAVADSLVAARAMARRPPGTPQLMRRLPLPLQDHAASAGRTMAGDVCAAWGLAPLIYPARAIMSELITNAVEHAGTDMVVSVSVRGDVLHLAVQDENPALPSLILTSPYVPGEMVEQRGAGLRLVQATASAWGALPCRVGKVVWATLPREAGAQ